MTFIFTLNLRNQRSRRTRNRGYKAIGLSIDNWCKAYRSRESYSWTSLISTSLERSWRHNWKRKRYIVAINKNGMKQHIFTVCILIKKQKGKFIHILKSADLSPKSLCIYTGRPLINTVHNKTPKNTQGKIFLRPPFR